MRTFPRLYRARRPGQVAVLHTVWDSNGRCAFPSNSSALRASTYDVSFEGLNWRGNEPGLDGVRRRTRARLFRGPCGCRGEAPLRSP